MLASVNSELFFRQQAGEVLDAQEEAGRPLIFVDQALPPDQLYASVLGQTGNNEPAAVILMSADPNAVGVSASAFPAAHRFLDATLEDPADLVEPLAGMSGATYVIALASRGDPTSETQERFSQAIRETYGYDADPVSFYGGTAAQVIGRALAAGSILEVNIPAEESVGGFAVNFDEQGRNTAASLSLFLIQDATLERIR